MGQRIRNDCVWIKQQGGCVERSGGSWRPVGMKDTGKEGRATMEGLMNQARNKDEKRAEKVKRGGRSVR